MYDTGCEPLSPPGADVLVRLAAALRTMPDDYPVLPADEPARWFQRDNGLWSPVYQDGRIGPEFTWAQMLAARGEDLGDAYEALAEAGIICGHDSRW
ncbi:hypothetical protein [Nocardia sp. CNY236]|uniref:hypothetical protein n=1 Tax=Nocardia sp. CNY236 TaxID=1169152 RepID=UPI0003FA9C2B|nr:hypothetical protein [Nocardia sp. CNY236]